MSRVNVGIMLAQQVRFDLMGPFASSEGSFCAANSVEAVEGKLHFNGTVCNELCFEPLSDDSRFLLHDVVIGVNFHWQRKENQLFKGALRFIVEEGMVRAINCLDVEDYLVIVISSEMSATSSLEFLKAHTIVSRSWLYAQLERREKNTVSCLGWENDEEVIRWYAREDHTNFDLCADDHCQRYQGLTRALNPNVERAVRETSGMVLMYDGKVCDARFSKCCGGVTERFSACWENIDYDYLAVVRDNDTPGESVSLSNEEAAREWIESAPVSFCDSADKNVLSQILNGYDRETNDFYRWRVEYTQSELSELIARRSGIDFGTIEQLQPVERGASGRLVKLRVVGSKLTKVVGKELEIRRWLSDTHLYSSAFVVDKVTDDNGVRFVLKGAGWGHGVGLCQIGAALMGEKGYTCRQILSHYYPGSNIESYRNSLNLCP